MPTGVVGVQGGFPWQDFGRDAAALFNGVRLAGAGAPNAAPAIPLLANRKDGDAERRLGLRMESVDNLGAALRPFGVLRAQAGVRQASRKPPPPAGVT